MSVMPNTAMIFAAGLGTRMRSHRADIPKPLVPVAGRALIDGVLDKLVTAGVRRAVINVSYLGGQIETHLAGRRDIDIVFSREDKPLETGGGIAQALEFLGTEPFFVINSDIGWVDGKTPALKRLAEGYDPKKMDALLLLCPLDRAIGYDGAGDFFRNDEGRLKLRGKDTSAPYVFTGVQLFHPRLMAPYAAVKPVPVFSLREFLQQTDASGWCPRMYGMEHDAEWLHIGDGAGVAQAEAFLKKRK